MAADGAQIAPSVQLMRVEDTDLWIDDRIDDGDPFWAAPVRYSQGASRSAMAWQTVKTTRKHFILSLARFQRGEKDGACLLQGALTGTERKGANMASAATLMVDVDSGQPLSELIGTVSACGLACLIWSTHSHSAAKQKHRLLFWLDEPFAFDGSAARLDEWKCRYLATIAALGIEGDQACKDAARLMYVPRCAPGALIDDPLANPAAHHLVLLAGGALKLADVPQPVAAERRAHIVRSESLETGDGDWQTKDLAKFLKLGASSFGASDWLFSVAPDDKTGGNRPGEHDHVCPNAPGHNTTPERGRSFHVKNASANGDAGFAMWCLSESCRKAASAAKPNGTIDRGFYLDLACRQHGIVDALELLEWCSEDLRATWQTANNLAAEIDALTRGDNDFDTSALTGVCRAIALLEPDTAALRRMEDKIKGRTGDSLKTIREIICNEREDLRGDAFAARSFADEIDNLQRRIVEANAKCTPPRIYFADDIVRLVGKEGERSAEVLAPPAYAYEFNKLLGHKHPLPHDSANALRGHPDWSRNLPPFKAIIRTPIFGPDGTLRTAPGYDRATGYFLDPDPAMHSKPLPSRIEDEHLEEACRIILGESVRDLPFSDVFSEPDPLPIYSDALDADGWRVPNLDRGPGSRANYLAMVLQPFARLLIDGPCPSFHVSKETHGEGGTLLVQCAGIIATGSEVPATPLAKDEAEISKTLLPLIRNGRAYVLFDNVAADRRLDSESLAAVITSGRWEARILGQSETALLDVVGSLVFTSVGPLAMSVELRRRIVPIRLSTGDPHPENRPLSGFKHGENRDWHRANRADLVWSCHVLIANWIQRGRPLSTAVPFGSFEQWAGVMGGILEAADIYDLLSNVGSYRTTDSSDGQAHQLQIAQLFARYGFEPFGADDALAIARANVGLWEAVGLSPEIIQGYTASGSDRWDQRRITKHLRGLATKAWDVRASGGNLVRVSLVKCRDRNPVQWQFIAR